MKVILAGTFRQAFEYARAKGWPMHDWRYAAGCHGVHGLRDYELHRIGTWDQLPARVIQEALSGAASIFP